MSLANELELPGPPQPIRIKENFLSKQVDRYKLTTNMDETNWSNFVQYYSWVYIDKKCMCHYIKSLIPEFLAFRY